MFLLLPGTSLPVLRILLVATLKRSREDPSTGTGTDWYGMVVIKITGNSTLYNKKIFVQVLVPVLYQYWNCTVPLPVHYWYRAREI